jgi:hypothetical protein
VVAKLEEETGGAGADPGGDGAGISSNGVESPNRRRHHCTTEVAPGKRDPEKQREQEKQRSTRRIDSQTMFKKRTVEAQVQRKEWLLGVERKT